MIYRDVKKFSGFEKVLVELENDCLRYNEKNLEKCYMISGDGKHKLPAVIGKYDETSKKYICYIDKQIESMVKNRYISIHNHPDNLTFSGADLYLFLKYDKIKQMRVVTASQISRNFKLTLNMFLLKKFCCKAIIIFASSFNFCHCNFTSK